MVMVISDFYNPEYSTEEQYTLDLYRRSSACIEDYEINDDFDDADQNTEFANALGTPDKRAQEISFTIDSPEDMDRYAVEMNAGDKLSIYMKLPSGYTDSTMQYRIEVHEAPSDGVYMCSSYNNPGSSHDKSVTYIAEKSGTYYAAVRSLTNEYDCTLKGQLYITKTPSASMDTYEKTWTIAGITYTNDFIFTNVLEINETRLGHSTASEMNGNEISSKIDNELDMDWYEMTPESSSTKKLTLDSSNLSMILLGNDMGKIANSTTIQHNFTARETYYIGIYMRDDASVSSESYTLRSETKENCPNLVFNDSVQNEYYIFDDNPEYIRRCDILDDGWYPSSALMHVYHLKPGKYNVFAYHHVSLESVNDGYTPPDARFANNTELYFDAVFSNSDGAAGNINITRLGFYTHADSGWDCNINALYEYEEIRTETKYKNKYVYDSPLWLSDLTGTKKINKINVENNNKPEGIVHLLMEFEVTDGMVDFMTVAYRNKENAQSKFGSTTPGNIQSKYEYTETLKGMAKSPKTKTANQLTYNIDNNTKPGTLYTTIENQFYRSRTVDAFATNCSPWEQRHNYSGSSSVNLEFNGEGIISRNSVNADIAESGGSRVWYLDSLHSRFLKECAVPDVAKIGAYAEKTNFSANEEFDSQWLYDVGELNNTDLFNQFNGNDTLVKGISTSFICYGITYEIPIRIYNGGTNARTFTYRVKGDQYKIEYSAVTDDGEFICSGKEILENKVGLLNEYNANVTLKPNKYTNITVKVTMITGSKGVIVHKFELQ